MTDTKDMEISWPDGTHSIAKVGSGWLEVASEAGIPIPTACIKGSCGACEIEVNGKIIRSCTTKVSSSPTGKITIEFPIDPYW